MALDFIGFINANTPGLSAQKKLTMLYDFCDNFNGISPTGTSVAQQVVFANERIQSFIIQCVEETRKVRAEKVVEIEKLILA
jgi:hypothetical protein